MVRSPAAISPSPRRARVTIVDLRKLQAELTASAVPYRADRRLSELVIH